MVKSAKAISYIIGGWGTGLRSLAWMNKKLQDLETFIEWEPPPVRSKKDDNIMLL